jgi:hypothetical protein
MCICFSTFFSPVSLALNLVLGGPRTVLTTVTITITVRKRFISFGLALVVAGDGCSAAGGSRATVAEDGRANKGFVTELNGE